MRRASIVRLSLLLFVLAFSMVTAPSHAFPLCPSGSCSYYFSLCEEDGGVPSRSYSSGFCQDENYYLRGHGTAYCTLYGSTNELGECADY
jgi:hypothetical protein